MRRAIPLEEERQSLPRYLLGVFILSRSRKRDRGNGRRPSERRGGRETDDRRKRDTQQQRVYYEPSRRAGKQTPKADDRER